MTKRQKLHCLGADALGLENSELVLRWRTKQVAQSRGEAGLAQRPAHLAPSTPWGIGDGVLSVAAFGIDRRIRFLWLPSQITTDGGHKTAGIYSQFLRQESWIWVSRGGFPRGL